MLFRKLENMQKFKEIEGWKVGSSAKCGKCHFYIKHHCSVNPETGEICGMFFKTTYRRRCIECGNDTKDHGVMHCIKICKKFWICKNGCYRYTQRTEKCDVCGSSDLIMTYQQVCSKCGKFNYNRGSFGAYCKECE